MTIAAAAQGHWNQLYQFASVAVRHDTVWENKARGGEAGPIQSLMWTPACCPQLPVSRQALLPFPATVSPDADPAGRFFVPGLS